MQSKGPVVSCFSKQRWSIWNGSGRGNCWLCSLGKINSPSSVLQGAKYEYSFPPLHPRQPPPDSCSELPPHTLVTSWQHLHALCDLVRKRTVCLQLRFTHALKHGFLPLVKCIPNPCRGGHKPAESGLKSNECYQTEGRPSQQQLYSPTVTPRK